MNTLFKSGIRRSKAEGNPKSEVRNPNRAFSLIEILVTIGLLTVIILGLLLMFNQTQRAFRTGMTQTDVLEAGRATLDIIARDVEQMSPSQYPDIIQNGVRYRAKNFFVEPFPDWTNLLVQELPGYNLPRTNEMQRFYFTTKLNQDWLATGYEVVPDGATSWVGTLYRFSATNYPRGGLFTNDIYFAKASITNMSRVADGIVHLRLRTFANNGFLLTTNALNRTNATYQTRWQGPYTNLPNAVLYNSPFLYGNSSWASTDIHQAACYFYSNALPAYVELELGVLEPQILQKYRSIPLTSAAEQYLSNHVAQVHIFRQRIPIRNVDLSAYP